MAHHFIMGPQLPTATVRLAQKFYDAQEAPMHATNCRVFVALVLVMFQIIALARDNTRLLPDSAAKMIAVQWKQDGRAVDIKASNPIGAWVVTAILIEIRFAPTKTPYAGEIKLDKAGRAVLVPPKPGAKVEEYWSEQEPERPVLKVEIQPGRDAPSVHELKFTSTIAGIIIVEARGREQTTFERLKSKVL